MVTHEWIKFSNGSGGNNCVEVKLSDDGTKVLVRHSKHPDGLILPFTLDEWDSFIKGAKVGYFDLK